MSGIVVDNFAGGGGASTGIEEALGRPVDIAVNHSRAAIAMHTANHRETRHYCEDIWTVDPKEAAAGRVVEVAWFSPDCFPAGTMVLTRRGYAAIETIGVGDEVLTHERRWRRVTSTMSTRKPVLTLRGHGHPGLRVSAEHPFLVRQRSQPHRGGPWSLGPAAWTPAGNLAKGAYWATPTAFPGAEPPAIPVYRGRSLKVSPELMWLAGRYIADGWTRLTNTRAELVITCGRHEVDGLRERLNAWPREGARCGADELAWSERETATAYQFATSHRGLVEWLREHFGHRAEAKRLPGWSLGMDDHMRRSLLDGYLSGDGWSGHGLVEASTVSKALAFSIKALASTLGFTAAVYWRANTPVIQGRRVNARPSWNIRWRADLDPLHRQTVREEGLEWAPVRERKEDVDVEEVFNLSVEEDESYIADGIAVHNCTHFSRAKGGQPRSKGVRGLADVVIRWARAVKPRLILLENVEEFQTWGPLDDNGYPIKSAEGSDFRAWLAALVDCGYQVEYRVLVAADYGAPTTRKRFFLIARCDGQPIVWPKPTHGRGRETPWRTAAEVIDWTLPCPSIFDRKRPLADATMRRIAAGLRRYVIDAATPFVVPLTHQGPPRTHPLDEPLRTVTAANRGELALVTPYVTRVDNTSDGRLRGLTSCVEPLKTVTSAGGFALVSPTLITAGYGEREGQAPRVPGLDKPLGTVVAGGQKHALVTAFLAKHYGGVVGHGVERPVGAVTARDHHSLVTAQLELPGAVASSFVSKFYGTSTGAGVDEPLPTVTTGGGKGGGHLAEVRAFLVKYYGSDGDPQSQQQTLFGPLHTVTTKARFGLVTVHGQQYQIADIGMRMLAPGELFAAQGFPPDYVLDPLLDGKPLTKTQQIELAGNSVCPPAAFALVAANARTLRRAA